MRDYSASWPRRQDIAATQGSWPQNIYRQEAEEMNADIQFAFYFSLFVQSWTPAQEDSGHRTYIHRQRDRDRDNEIRISVNPL